VGQPRVVLGLFTVCLGHVHMIQPVGQMEIEIPLSFLFSLNSNLNLKNSYLPIQSSKNQETSYVSFLISRVIH
jgi:hypothetical protein